MSTSSTESDPQQTDLTIVRELLEAGDNFVSGARLAEIVGVSRVSIWAHMDKLRQAGYEVEAVRRKGYRLRKRPDTLDETLLRTAINLRGSLPELHFKTSVDSTNNEAERLLAGGASTPFVVIAREQTKGRGRLGRRWESDDCGNLYASFGFRPGISPTRMQDFTLWMGVNVCEAIANTCRIDVGVKWPNDILHAGRKLGGMLTEVRMDADTTREIVFGLGLNINSHRGDWPKEIVARTTSVAEASGRPTDINRVAGAVVTRVVNAVRAFVKDDYKDRFVDLWNRLDVLRGKRIGVLIGDQRVEGIADGIDSSGALRLKDDRGQTHRCLAGDVTIEKTPLG